MYTIHENVNGKEQILGTKDGEHLHFGSKEEVREFIEKYNIPIGPNTRIVYTIGEFLMHAYNPITLEESDYLGPMKEYQCHEIRRPEIID